MRIRPESLYPSGPLLESLENRVAPAALAFAFAAGNSQDQLVRDVVVDSNGNSYVIGTFGGTMDFDPGPGVIDITSQTNQLDTFVAKYTDAGALVWIKTLRIAGETAGDEQESHIAINNLGELFVSADFGRSAETTSIPVSVSFFDGEGAFEGSAVQPGANGGIYLAKIDAYGNFAWATAYGATTDMVSLELQGLKADNSGHIFLAGNIQSYRGFAGSVDFDSQTLSVPANNETGFVVKLDDGMSTPVAQWAAYPSTVSTSSFRMQEISINDSGGIVVTGSISTNAATSVTFPTSSPTVLTPDAANVVAAGLDSSGNWLWAVSATGGGSEDEGVTGAFDTSGNYFVSGEFSGSVNFGGNIRISNGGQDAFIWKLSATTGATFNAFTYGGTGNDNADGDVFIDVAGNIHVVGGFSGTVDFDSGGTHTLTSTGPDDIYLLSLTGSGGFNSVKRLDGTTNATNGNGLSDASDATFTPDGSLYIAGGFRGKFDADPGDDVQFLTSKGGSDFAILRILPDAIIQQTLEPAGVRDGLVLGGADEQGGYAVETDAAGNVYLAGLFTGTVDFDPGAGLVSLTSSDADGNVFLAKYSPNNTLIWVKHIKTDLTFSVQQDDINIQMGLDSSGNVYLAGQFNASVEFVGSTTLTSNDGGATSDVYITKINPSGVFEWAHRIGGTGFDGLNNLAVGPSGQIVLGGEFSQSIKYDNLSPFEIPVNPGSDNNTYVLQLNTNGGLDWHRQFSDASLTFTEAEGVTYDQSGNVYFQGSFRGTVDFNVGGSADPVTRSTLSDSLYVAKLSGSTGVVSWRNVYDTGAQISDGAMGVTSEGDVIAVGSFNGYANLDPGQSNFSLLSAGGADTFILKLDSDGLFIDAISFGGADDDFSANLNIDGEDNIFVSGDFHGIINFDRGHGLAVLTPTGDVDLFMATYSKDLEFKTAFKISAFNSQEGNETSGSGLDLSRDVDLHVDAKGAAYLSGNLSGSLDFDSGAAVKKFSSKGGLDALLLKFTAPNVADAGHIRSFTDADGDKVTVKVTGPGYASYTLTGGAGTHADLALLELEETAIATTLTITVEKNGATTVSQIMTLGGNDSVGSITLGTGIVFGSGLSAMGAPVDLLVTGAMKSLVLEDVAANTIISLGSGLPYNFGDTTTPDTYNNKPTITIRDVLGAGVSIEVLSDTARAHTVDAQGIGGGGLGNITIRSWEFDGSIKTTQSIGNLTVTGVDTIFLANLEIDRYHNGNNTTANTGNINIPKGALAGNANFIEGFIGAIKAGALSGNITAEGISSIAISSSSAATVPSFTGVVTLTGTTAATALKFFNVQGDFMGAVITDVAVGNLNILGEFTGSIRAKSIGVLKAYSFNGDDPLGTNNLQGNATLNDIIATNGGIGTLIATKGGISNYEIVTTKSFGGMTVSLSNLTTTTTGIENVSVTAFSIGNIAVTLKGKSTATGYSLTGIAGSTFTTTGTGTGSKASPAGNMGTITVTLAGSAGQLSATGITGTTFDSDNAGAANKIGAIKVAMTAQAGVVTGITSTSVFVGDILSSTSVTVTGTAGLNAATGFAGSLTSTSGAIGTITIAVQGSSLATSANGLVGILDADIHAATALGKVTVTAKNVSKLDSGATQPVFTINSSAAPVSITSGTGEIAGLSLTAVTSPGGGGNAETLHTEAGGNITIDAGGDIGGITVSATKGKAGSTAQALHGLGNVFIHADGKIASLTVNGDATGTQVNGLVMTAGRSIGNVSVTSKTAANGSIINSLIAAGQDAISLAGLTSFGKQQAELKKYALGNVTVSGSIDSTTLAAGSSIGAVKVGAGTDGNLIDSLLIAGVRLNSTNPLDLDNTYHRQASIGAITVAGQMARTSIAAGVDPVDAAWGNADDLFAANLPNALADLIAKTSAIGKVTAGDASVAFGAAEGFNTANGVILHLYGIVSETIADVKTGSFTAVIPATGALYLDGDSLGEQANDIAIRTGSAS